MMSMIEAGGWGQFTLEMESMLTELTVASDHKSIFKEFITTHFEFNHGIDLAVSILSSDNWILAKLYICSDIRREEQRRPLPKEREWALTRWNIVISRAELPRLGLHRSIECTTSGPALEYK